MSFHIVTEHRSEFISITAVVVFHHKLTLNGNAAFTAPFALDEYKPGLSAFALNNKSYTLDLDTTLSHTYNNITKSLGSVAHTKSAAEFKKL